VLLFLHSGPGLPVVFLNITYPTGRKQNVAVVWWEQRGASLSKNLDIPPQTMADGSAED